MPWSSASPRDCNTAGEAEPKASAQGSKAKAETPQGLLCCCLSIPGSSILCPGEPCAVCHQQSQCVFGRVPVTSPRSSSPVSVRGLWFAAAALRARRTSRPGGSFPYGWDRRCFLLAPAGSCTNRHPRPAPSSPCRGIPARPSAGREGLGGSDNCIGFLFPSLLWRDQRSGSCFS